MTDSVNFNRAALNYNNVADEYESGRPDYQDHIVDRVVELFDAGPKDTIADLAAGTGKFTRCLLASGARVVAIEPVAAMASQLHRVVEGVSVVRAYAGRLPLADETVAGMSVAQAFQWLDQTDMPELIRVLRPGAVLALVWNKRQDTRDWSTISEVLAPFRNAKARRVDAHRMLEESQGFAGVETQQWQWVRRIDRARLHAHVRSLSWIAALDSEARSQLESDLDQALGEREQHELDYVSELIFARRR